MADVSSSTHLARELAPGFATARVVLKPRKARPFYGRHPWVLDSAVARYGDGFATVLATCRVWVNGDTAGRDVAVGVSDEVAVLPPVSGGFQ